MLNKISQSQRQIRFQLYSILREVRLLETESRMDCQGESGEVIGISDFMGIEFQFCRMKSFESCLYNTVNILIKTVKMINFRLSNED